MTTEPIFAQGACCGDGAHVSPKGVPVVHRPGDPSQSVPSDLVTIETVAAAPAAAEAISAEELAPLTAISPNGNGNGNGSLAVSRIS